jgi:hypothetical protein
LRARVARAVPVRDPAACLEPPPLNIGLAVSEFEDGGLRERRHAPERVADIIVEPVLAVW